jgi:hypothetical protein
MAYLPPIRVLPELRDQLELGHLFTGFQCKYLIRTVLINLRKIAAGDYTIILLMPGQSGRIWHRQPPQFTVGRAIVALIPVGIRFGSPKFTISPAPDSGNISFHIDRRNADKPCGNPYPSTIDWKSSNWIGYRTYFSGVASGGYDYGYGMMPRHDGVFNSRGSDGSGTMALPLIAPDRLSLSKPMLMANLVFRTTRSEYSNTQQWRKDGEVDFPVIRLPLPPRQPVTTMNWWSSSTWYHDGSEKFWSLYNEAPEIYSIVEGNAYSLTRLSELS